MSAQGTANPTASWKAGGRVGGTLIQGSDEEATSCTVASNVFPSGSAEAPPPQRAPVETVVLSPVVTKEQ